VTCPAIHSAVGFLVTAILTSRLRVWRRITTLAQDLRRTRISASLGARLKHRAECEQDPNEKREHRALQ
jgi:hypothetical protein